MPGSVANASVTAGTVLPLSLSKAFAHSREFQVLDNEYRDGTSQRSKLSETSRKTWRIAKRLTPTVLATLRDFYDDLNGPHEPFFFYDPWDVSPQFSYDPTGTSPTGRYTVRFEGPWEQMIGIGRAEVNIAIVELA